MKTLICTSKIRPDGMQTVFPPLGAMAIIQGLVKAGYQDTALFDIDGLRPPYADVVTKFRQERPDVVGISGVVSTSYAFIKRLISTIHAELPGTPVIVGGNVAANAEILHRLAGADYCVIGEGEQTTIELMAYLADKGGRSQQEDYSRLKTINGLTYLNDKGTVHFTGYRPNIPADGLYDLDYDILERDTDISKYIIEPWIYPSFVQDRRSLEIHRQGQKLATLVTTKGCVARCTFCHRWDKGIRFVGVDRIIERIKALQARYDIGFISFGDENFGSDHKWVDEFLEKIAPLDLLWRVGGVRCRTVNLGMLRRMRDAGCIQVQYGIESGSQRILDVMEKNTTVEMSRDAVMWTHQAGINYLIYSMVFGMPGESPETIKETIAFLKGVTVDLPNPPYTRLSMNRLEALPGTPVYEYAKVLGLIGRTPEAEEKYLLHISDTSGGDIVKQMNFTDYPEFIVQSWKRLIWLEVMHHWLISHPGRHLPLPTMLWKNAMRLFNKKRHVNPRVGFRDPSKGRELIDSFVDKDFNTRRDEMAAAAVGLHYHPKLHFLARFVVLEVVVKNFLDKRVPKRVWLKNALALIVYLVKGPNHNFAKYQSVRATMKELKPDPLTESEENLLPLQLGR